MFERDAEAVLLLANSLAAVGRCADAVTLLRGLAAGNAADIRALRLLARVLLADGKYADAEPVARQLAESASGDDLPAALFFHAHSLWGCGKVEACKQQVERYSAALDAARK